jgi:crotonobetainyl-CoA:carnitine CoA-transferase CaiB-like acyl-CoA transferase
VDDALYNEQTDAREMVRTIEDDGEEIPVIEHPLNFGNVSTGFESAPPDLGEHNDEVFGEIGYDEAQLERLRREGAFGDSDD